MPGPLLRAVARRRCKLKLLEQGYSRSAVNDVLDDLDDEVVDAEYARVAGTSAIGDGEFLHAILEWLKSEQGQAFLDALMKILLALLAGL